MTNQEKKEIRFKKASIEDYELLMQWLKEPHIMEFWDNSPEHREDILIFMQGRSKPSPYFGGIFTYWVAMLDQTPYSLLMTSEILNTEPDLLPIWQAHLSKKGKTYSIDFLIGNKHYLNRGLAGPTLEAFARYISDVIDLEVDTFFIDPAVSNSRAIHVYEKAGFEIKGEFQRDFEGEQNVKHLLMVKKLVNKAS